MNGYIDKVRRVIDEVSGVIIGKDEIVREVMLSFIANGHILLEDIPGVGKTTLALAFSRALGLECRRVQFTPDVMPSDLTGFSVYMRNLEKFEYQPGSVFCNLLLADEINRTSLKKQSALLEVMEERKVSVDGETRPVPSPFLVIATQNPFGSAGTELLPESQMDRFMTSMSLGYPDFESEVAMAMTVNEYNRADTVKEALSKDELIKIQHDVHDIYIKESVYRYIVALVAATRQSPYLEKGASPRATVALVKMSKSAAWLDVSEYVTPDHVKDQFPYVVFHRIVLSAEAGIDGVQKEQIISEILDSVEKPPLGEKLK